jgi:hypothetical protein
MVPLSEDWARRELRICTRKGLPLPAPARLLLDFLLGQAECHDMPRLELATRNGVHMPRVAALV